MRARRFALVSLALVFAAVFSGLGVWQVERLRWKTALIAQVETRATATPVPAPRPDDRIGAGRSYQAVVVRGVFQNDRETLVQAVTELGPGYWVLTPLRSDVGFTILINRGFVPQDLASHGRDWSRPAGMQVITGLLRTSEPKGGFLRANDPVADRWRSRDVGAISGARNLSGSVAPYFIDAGGEASGAEGWPRGGLTRIAFPNSHLVYALTWFALALMSLFAVWRVLRDGRGEDLEKGTG